MALSGPCDPEGLGPCGLNLSFSCPGPETHGRPALLSALGVGGGATSWPSTWYWQHTCILVPEWTGRSSEVPCLVKTQTSHQDERGSVGGARGSWCLGTLSVQTMLELHGAVNSRGNGTKAAVW